MGAQRQGIQFKPRSGEVVEEKKVWQRKVWRGEVNKKGNGRSRISATPSSGLQELKINFKSCRTSPYVTLTGEAHTPNDRVLGATTSGTPFPRHALRRRQILGRRWQELPWKSSSAVVRKTQ